MWIGLVIALVAVVWWLWPRIQLALNTVTTDDAYVNGHATFVAPRVAGQVIRVLVEDNMPVKRGDVLVELDEATYRTQVAIRQAAVEAAERDIAAAQAQVRGLIAQVRSNRFRLQHAMEEVRHRIELLKANVAQLKQEQASLELAEQEYTRGKELYDQQALSEQQLDRYAATLEVARNRVISADQIVQQTRAGLGLPINRDDPGQAPADLDQTHSTVLEALGVLYQSAVVVGFTPSTWDATPKEAFDEFFAQDPEGDLDKIYGRIMLESPAVRQAEARLAQTRRELEDAELDLQYCRVVSEIDGIVTRRSVNPGNIVQPGQALMAVRSLTDIWIDANFKETQLADLRIGQRVRCEIDMYGAEREFEGRITGFTMGTGSTLSLLPAQNATGNFVKVVQRLPVRIELTDYDPQQAPLFIGLSCEPRVFIHEPLLGDDPGKGQFLQEYRIATGTPATSE